MTKPLRRNLTNESPAGRAVSNQSYVYCKVRLVHNDPCLWQLELTPEDSK
jgi:hypothetical protein